MKRSIFLFISAVIGLLFGGMMLFIPDKAAEGFGISATPETLMFFRAMGESILGMGVLAFLVRNDSDSKTLKAILIFFMIYHGLGLLNDVYSIAQGLITFTKVLPGILAHLFVGIGSFYYAVRMKN